MFASSFSSHPDRKQDVPSFMNSDSAAKPSVSRFRAWLVGMPGNGDKHAHVQSPPRLDPLDPRDPDLTLHPPLPPAGSYWVECFLNAVSEASTLFARRHVELVHNEDPSTVYAVREVKIECKNAPTQFLREVASLPEEVRNRVIKSRVQKADGVKGLLLLDDFYGSTIVADITLVDGQVVQTLVSYSGSRFELKFAFEGRYVTRPELPAAEPAAAPPAKAETLAAEPATTGPASVTDASMPDLTAAQSIQQTVLRSKVAPPTPDVQATVLRVMAPPQVKPIAMLRLRSLDLEVTLPLLQDHFPYTIGRHPSFKGYSVRSQQDAQAVQLLQDREGAGFVSFVSRDHVVLDSYDALTQQFRVVAGKGKNGTYFRAMPMPSHFLLPMGEMAKGHWLKLGGTDGDGILELRIEAV